MTAVPFYRILRCAFLFVFALYYSLSALSAALASAEMFQGGHIVSIEVGHEKAWAKKPDPGKTGLKGCFKNAVAQLIPLAFLRPSYSCSQAQALQLEASRIHELQAQGILVPRILEETSEWIVISDMGPTIDSLLRQNPTHAEKIKLAVHSAQALAMLHQKGQWHGRGEIRDMTLTSSGEIGFIDFEENPQSTLFLKQSRDFLLFLFSVSEFFESPQDLALIICTYQSIAPYESYRAAYLIFTCISPFNSILKIALSGRDGVRLINAIAQIESALKSIECQKNPS